MEALFFFLFLLHPPRHGPNGEDQFLSYALQIIAGFSLLSGRLGPKGLRVQRNKQPDL
jgi:hypothetical protein